MTWWDYVLVALALWFLAGIHDTVKRIRGDLQDLARALSGIAGSSGDIDDIKSDVADIRGSVEEIRVQLKRSQRDQFWDDRP